MGAFDSYRSSIETDGRRLARWFVRKLQRMPLSPNAITLSGTVLNGVAAWLVIEERFVLAAVVFIVGSILDALDGAVAVVMNKTSPFGSFLDSTMDRVSEGLMLGALGIMFAKDDATAPLAACFIALAGSYLVSYTRAKAESIGVECKVGFASRFERIVVLSAGLLLTGFGLDRAIDIAAYVLAVTASLTVLQRVLHVRRQLRAAA